MFHENIRAARNHRALAARAVTVASEMPPTATTAAEEKTDEKATKTVEKPPKAAATDADPVVATTTAVSATTSAVLESVDPTKSNTVITADTTTSAVLPATTTSSVATPLTSSVATPSTSSSASAPVKLITITTVAPKASSTSHAAVSAKASASSTPVATGAVSGGAVAGGVIGGLAGLVLLAVVVFFVVRRYRRKELDNLIFKASKFRRSALLLDDSPTLLEKEKMQEQRGPRPPSMIARHLNAPAVPQASAASPYSEHTAHSTDPYGHYATTAAQYNVGMYGADGQVTRDPYADIYGGNSVSGQHAHYGQPGFGAPSMQFQFPQRYNQEKGYQSSFAPGAHGPASPVDAPLPNPFSNVAPSPLSAAIASQTNSISSGSSRSTSKASSKHEVVLRRQTQPGGAPPANEEDLKYADMQRDVKVDPRSLVIVNSENGGSSSSPPAIPVVSTSTSTSAAPTSPNPRRPMSSYTVYDPADAYGGM